MTAHKRGDTVQSLVKAQGIHLGHIYKVIEVHETRRPFGLYVAYDLEDSAGKQIAGIQNGHLILNSVKKAEQPPPQGPRCGVCQIEDDKDIETVDKGSYSECPACGSRFPH